MRVEHLLLAAHIGLGASAGAAPGYTALAEHLVAKAGIRRGLCSLPRCGDGRLAVALSESSELRIHAMTPRPEDALRLVDSRGLIGRRVTVEKGAASQLPYADHMIDLVLVADLSDRALSEVSLPEVLRVLRPNGKALLGRSAALGTPSAALTPEALRQWLAKGGIQNANVSGDRVGLWAVVTKPALAGADAWSHWQHGPDNNPVSTDRVIRAPYLTQWLGKPYYMAMPVVTTAAAGRIFVASGHIAHHEREVPTLQLLCARNGYNGTVLWRRKLPEGYLVHRSAFVATADTFYMIDGSGCLMLDPETGAERRRAAVPGVQGEWKWMAMERGLLFVLAGPPDPAAETTRVQSGRDHWSWGQLSKGYYRKPHIPWGFGDTIAAYDLRRGATRWVHREPRPVDSRAMGVRDGKVFFHAPESRIGCLDARSGRLLWTNADAEVLQLIQEPGTGLTSTPGFRTSCRLLCAPRVLCFEAQTRMNVVGVSADDGSLLWRRSKTRNNPTVLSLDGQLIANIGPNGGTLALDPMTGQTLGDLHFRKVNCVRMTACPDAIFCRGEGLGRYDRARGTYAVDGSARPGCMDGAIPANGLLYVGPWLCDCNLSLIGTVALCSAAGHEFGPPATQERLETLQAAPSAAGLLRVDAFDWATYRGNNQRTSASIASVPARAKQLWEYRPRAASEPSAPSSAGGRLFVGGGDGKVLCLDAKTGKRCWEFVTAGPVRLPPTVWQGRAYVGSGDGYVYAIEAAGGRLLWRFRAAPVQRRIMAYGSLCSTWPVNSGVLVADGVAYAAAGIIDRDGTYVYALDATTGRAKWQNGRTGHLNKAIRKGVSVQGCLTVARGQLWLAGGNQISPAPYDLATGRCLTQQQALGPPRNNRGCEVGVFDERFIVRGGRLMYSGQGKVVSSSQFGFIELNSRGEPTYPEVTPLARSSIPPAWDGDVFVTPTDRYGQLGCWDAARLRTLLYREKARRLELDQQRLPWRRQRQELARFQEEFRDTRKWALEPGEVCALAVAANAVVAVCDTRQPGQGGPQWQLCALDKGNGRVLWQHPLPGEPLLNGLLIDRFGHVVVVLGDGRVLCFG